MSNSGTKEPSPQTSTAQSPPEPQRRGRGRPRKQQQVGTSRSEKAMFIWGVGPPGTQNGSTPRLSLSPSRSRSDHRLRSGLEDDRKAARTKAPKLHRRLSPKLLFFFFFFYIYAYIMFINPHRTCQVCLRVCVCSVSSGRSRPSLRLTRKARWYHGNGAWERIYHFNQQIWSDLIAGMTHRFTSVSSSCWCIRK